MTVTQIIPFSYQDHQIRIVQVESESYFIGKDVCDALGLVRTNSAMRKLDDDEKLMRKIYASGQTRDVWLVNESGLYHLIFRSNKPEARAFRKWVTNEVLPSIRRRGYYTPQQPTGTQLALFEQDSPQLERIKREMLKLAISAGPRSRLARFLRLIAPVVYGKSSNV